MKLDAALRAGRVALPARGHMFARLRLFGRRWVDGALEDGESRFEFKQTGSGGILEQHRDHSSVLRVGRLQSVRRFLCLQFYNIGGQVCQ